MGARIIVGERTLEIGSKVFIDVQSSSVCENPHWMRRHGNIYKFVNVQGGMTPLVGLRDLDGGNIVKFYTKHVHEFTAENYLALGAIHAF